MRAARLTNEDWCDEGFSHAIRHALLKGATLREISSKAAETAIHLALEDESNNIRVRRADSVRPTAPLQMRRAADRRRDKNPCRRD